MARLAAAEAGERAALEVLRRINVSSMASLGTRAGGDGAAEELVQVDEGCGFFQEDALIEEMEVDDEMNNGVVQLREGDLGDDHGEGEEAMDEEEEMEIDDALVEPRTDLGAKNTPSRAREARRAALRAQRVSKRRTQRKAGRRAGAQEGAQAARDAIAAKYGSSSPQARAAQDPTSAEVAARAAAEASLGVAAAALVTLATQTGGAVGYDAGLRTANAALNTHYAAADVRTEDSSTLMSLGAAAEKEKNAKDSSSSSTSSSLFADDAAAASPRLDRGSGSTVGVHSSTVGVHGFAATALAACAVVAAVAAFSITVTRRRLARLTESPYGSGDAALSSTFPTSDDRRDVSYGALV